MSSPSGPPAQPPQISPDGKWFWDGSRWQPIAIHEAIFPTWESVGAGMPAQPAAAAQRIPSPPTTLPSPPPSAAIEALPSLSRAAVPLRAPVYRVPAPAPQPQTDVPLWRQPGPSRGLTKYMYGAAAVIGLIGVGIVLSSIGTITFPWQQGPPAQVVPKATPGLSARSDSARADFLINQVLASPMTGLSDSVALVTESCQGGLTTSCQDALVTVDNKTSALLQLIDQQTPPACVAVWLTRVRSDLAKVDAGAQQAVKGFKDNRPGEVQSGEGQVGPWFGQAQADDRGMQSAAQGCDTQLTGP